jgi:plasmid stabilization system protein ParE
MKVRLVASASEELRVAAEFYEGRARGLGMDFLTEAENTRDLIAHFPEIGPVLEADIRRLSFRRFPYSYLYRLMADEAQVLAAMHHSRRPGYWKDRT